jgi:hypothetical protein
MPFHDDNTIEDIMGCYLAALYWREGESDVDIEKQLSEFIERILDKLARNQSKTRHNWFTIALEHAQLAQEHFREKHFEHGREQLRLSWTHLESGNKANRRRVTFIAGPGGEVQHT